MTVRTISDLKKADILTSGDLFEISHVAENTDDIRYASQKLTYDALESNVVSAAIREAKTVFNIQEGADISSMTSRLDSISSAMDVSDQSVVSFRKTPRSEGECAASFEIPNRSQVIDLIGENAEFVGSESFVKADPGNDSGMTVYDPARLYEWHIDDGQRDSSKWRTVTGTEAGAVKITETGYLVMYGWLASNSEVTAQEAWVGLFAKVFTGGEFGEQKWVLLQAQPWTLGKNYQVAQYIGFNAPVRKGLELKVMTGFKVSGAASGLGVGNTLMFKGEGDMPNTFVGYVIQN